MCDNLLVFLFIHFRTFPYFLSSFSPIKENTTLEKVEQMLLEKLENSENGEIYLDDDDMRKLAFVKLSANLDIDSTPFIMSSIFFFVLGSFCIFSKSLGLTVRDLPFWADTQAFPTRNSTLGTSFSNSFAETMLC